MTVQSTVLDTVKLYRSCCTATVFPKFFTFLPSIDNSVKTCTRKPPNCDHQKMLQVFISLVTFTTVSAGFIPGFGAQSPVAPTRFSFGQAFVGQWTVSRRDSSMLEDHRDSSDEMTSFATYNILSENYTTALVGAYHETDGEVGHLVRLEFDDETLNSGKFFTAGPKEEEDEESNDSSPWLEDGDDDSLLFDFDFTNFEGDTTRTGMEVSSGIWRSQTTKSGWYNFIFYGPNTFVLNVVPHDAEGSAFIIRGVKVVKEQPRVEQPWYTRMMLPLSMFFVFRRFFGDGAAAPRAAAAAPAAGAPAAAATN